MFHIMLKEFQRTGSDVVVRVELISVKSRMIQPDPAQMWVGHAPCSIFWANWPVHHALATLCLFFKQGASAFVACHQCIATCPLEEIVRGDYHDSVIGRAYKVQWMHVLVNGSFQTPKVKNIPKVFRSNQFWGFWGQTPAEMIKDLLWPG